MITKTIANAKLYTYAEAVKLSTQYFNGDDLAADAFVRKYALKRGPNEILEPTPAEMFDRMANALAEVEPKDRAKWKAVFREQLDGFKKIVPQGSPMAALGNIYQKMTLSNCYVVPIMDDSLKSIFDALYEMAQIQAFRGGVGIDVSGLRPQDSRVNNAALRSTGAWSWCDLYSYVTRMIGQSGRQGALMLTMDVSHPDIEKFVKMKADLAKVTGANVSVKLTDEFMKAVVADDDFTMSFTSATGGIEQKIEKTVKARELWALIVKYATETAEPGLLMWDTILRRSPADAYAEQGFKTICTNPCSEIPLSAYDSCRLTSLNLTGFVKKSFGKDAEFDWDAFRESIHVGVRILDNIVDIDHDLQPFESQKRSNRNGRRLGLGTHGLADTLARLNKKYDDVSTIKFVDKLYEFMKIEAYKASINLAKERGPFPIFNWEQEKDNEFIKELPEDVKAEMAKYGRRNIALLTCAPTGTVSLMSRTSSGIEPVFRLSYTRRVKVNQADLFDPKEIEVDQKTGDRWRRFAVYHPAYKEFLDAGHAAKSGAWVTSDEINYKRRVEMQAAITRHLDHASSSTINLPAGTSQQVVGDIYIMAWKLGLKGVTVYVDGSRSGVLITDEKKPATGERPVELDAVAHTVSTSGNTYTVFIGLLDGVPYEVFCVPSKIADVTNGLQGKIIKIANKRYDFVSGKDEDGDWILEIKKINKNEDNEASAFTRLVSTALRHGIPIQTVNEQLDKAKGTVVSMAKAINRVLAKYVGKVTGRECPNCQSTNTVMEEGCMKCQDCAHAKCG